MTASPLWSGLGVIGPLEARVLGTSIPTSIAGISIDSRTLSPGDLFFAIRGETHDGHDYAAAAFKNGASAAVVDEDHADRLRGLGPLYVVHDVLAALQRLGRAARARTKARVVAITGSVGKTTTKEALSLVLGEAAPTHASVASYNNHWGVPLTLARMPEATRFGVFEIGMNHAGEIAPLTAMVRPHVAIITTVAPVHLEYLGSTAAIADAKGEVFSGVMKGGVAIIHRDIPEYEQLLATAKASPAAHVLTFGDHEEADARILRVDLEPLSSVVRAKVLGADLTYCIGAPGRHLATNSLAVLLASKALGLDIKVAARALKRLQPPQGRGARETLRSGAGSFTLIDESYNANPVSMRAALAVLGAAQPTGHGRRIAVLGDMLELGSDGPDLHRSLAQDLEANHVDLVFAAGPLMRDLFAELKPRMQGLWAERAADIQAAVIASIDAGDVVMIKGSNGSRLGPVVAALKEQCGANAIARAV